MAVLARTANLQTSMLVNTHFTILGNWWEAAGASLRCLRQSKSKTNVHCRSPTN